MIPKMILQMSLPHVNHRRLHFASCRGEGTLESAKSKRKRFYEAVNGILVTNDGCLLVIGGLKSRGKVYDEDRERRKDSRRGWGRQNKDGEAGWLIMSLLCTDPF
jgi:hypothetical protein